MQKVCVRCGAQHSRKSEHCTNACYKAGWQERRRGVVVGHVFDCSYCSLTFERKRQSQPGVPVYCSKVCAKSAFDDRQRAARRPLVKSCSECGAEFETFLTKAVACSAECKRIRANRRAYTPKQLASKSCAHCGGMFIPRTKSGCYCSTSCQREDYNTRRRRGEWRDMRLQRIYGVSADEYDAMFAAQGGGCAICGGMSSDRRLAVDHDHVSGQVRGLLCTLCNTSLGGFHDDVSKLRAAINYLSAPPSLEVLSREVVDIPA